MRNSGSRSRSVSRPVLYLLSLTLLVGCTGTTRGSGAIPSVGALMPSGSSIMGFAHKGRTLCAHSVEVKGVLFDFDVRCGSPVVVYVKTLDPDFRTPEGIAVGDLLEVAATIRESQVGVWNESCGVLLLSGWIARGERGDRELPCKDTLSEPIVYFDTPFLEK